MSISGQIIASTVQPQKQENTSASAAIKKSASAASLTAAEAVLPKLSENAALVRGEVIDLRTNQVVILLENGAQLSARLEANLPLCIGQKANFLVSQTTDSLITLKPAPEQSAENPLIDKILLAAGLQKNEHTVTIINELLAHQQPVTGSVIRRHMMLAARYPELPVKDLVLMELHKIPVTEETVSQFSEYRTDSHRLLTQGISLLNTLTAQLSSLPEGAEKTSFIKELWNILNLDTEKLNQDLVQKNNELNHKTLANPEKTPMNSTAVDKNSLFSDETTVVSSEQAAVKSDASSAFSAEAENLYASASAEAEGSTVHFADTLAVPPADTPAELPPSALLEQAKQKFFNSFLLSPKDIAAEGKVQNYYEQLNEQLSALEQLTEKLSRTTNNETSSGPAKQLRSNLSFMDMVNQIFPYVQLPLQFKEQTAHGELYVYEKKRALSGSGSLSALLHLELEALGTTDIFVTVAAASVSARFCLADETAKQLVTEELPALYKTLEKAGYSLKTEVALREDNAEDAPLLEQFLEEHSPSELNRYTFDIRA